MRTRVHIMCIRDWDVRAYTTAANRASAMGQYRHQAGDYAHLRRFTLFTDSGAHPVDDDAHPYGLVAGWQYRLWCLCLPCRSFTEHTPPNGSGLQRCTICGHQIQNLDVRTAELANGLVARLRAVEHVIDEEIIGIPGAPRRLVPFYGGIQTCNA